MTMHVPSQIKKTNDPTFIQYGCGWSAPQGWRNFDSSPTLRFERLPIIGSLYRKNENRFPTNVEYGDIVRGLPVRDGSVDGVYCSHVLEHLALSDFRVALQNTYKVLRPGGIFRLVLPDLRVLARQYLQREDDGAALEFIQKTGMGREYRGRGIKSFLISWLGNSQHLWMWDYKSMRNELRKVGFTEVRSASFGDSTNKRFDEVEDEKRWVESLGVECKKPV